MQGNNITGGRDVNRSLVDDQDAARVCAGDKKSWHTECQVSHLAEFPVAIKDGQSWMPPTPGIPFSPTFPTLLSWTVDMEERCALAMSHNGLTEEREESERGKDVTQSPFPDP